MGMRAGVTAGAVGLDPEVERITVTEIEPLVSAEIAGHFSRQNSDVVNNPKVDVRIDDGRHFLLTTHEMFDGVVSAPPAPWIPGAAMMYTTEFWRLVRSHLNPGGIAATSVRLYETSDDAVRSQLATFSSVFPNNAFFANIVPGDAYDVVLVGFRDDDGTIDVGRITERLQDSRYSQLARSLRVVEFESGIELLGTFAGTGRTMEDWLEGASINSDRNLRLQYLAGDAINRYSADAIVDRMLTTDETLPDGLFIGPLDLMNRLHQLIGQQQGRN
jgi:spermidine synthase